MPSYGKLRKVPVLYRLASHLPYDPYTPVLKMIINDKSNRKPVTPHINYLTSRGVFVLRPNEAVCNNIYIWRGLESSREDVICAANLAKKMLGIVSSAHYIILEHQHSESAEFMAHFSKSLDDSPESGFAYDDLFSMQNDKQSISQSDDSIHFDNSYYYNHLLFSPGLNLQF